MALTFGQIKGRILRRIGPGQATNTRLGQTIGEMVNESQDMICSLQPWSWLKARTTLTFTDASTYITLPSTCVEVKFVTLATGYGYGTPLAYQPEMVELLRDGTLNSQGRGIPTAWDVVPNADNSDECLLLMPLPAVAGTLDVLYQRDSTEMTEDADVPVIPRRFRPILIEHVMSKWAADDSYDPTIAQRAYAEYERMLRAMRFGSRKASPQYPVTIWPGDGELDTG